MKIFVAPDGNDAWSGNIEHANQSGSDGPKATLIGARDAIRSLRVAGSVNEPVQVIVADGEYQLAEPLVLTPEDSGTDAAPVSFEAVAGTRPVFTGGRRITGWQQGAKGIWTTQIPQVAAGDWYFEQLWVNDARATRARTPNKFYNYVQEAVPSAKDPNTGQNVDLSNRAFKARKDDFEIFETIAPEDMHDVTIIVYQSWESARARVDWVDPATRTVAVTNGISWGFAYWGYGCRYQVENVLAALDEPGEWFLSRDGTLSYMPLPGEDMTKAEVIAPAGPEDFIHFQGQAEMGLYVENITLRGLNFEHGQYILPATGHSDGQAEVTIPAVIMLDGSRNITIEDCQIKHHGLYGVWFRYGVSDCTMKNNWLEDMGAGGVKIGAGWGVDFSTPASQATNITIDNNIIHGGGRLHHGAIGVWIGHSGNNSVTHNDISDLYYTGVSVGWSWGYAPTISHNNHIDFNHIHNIGHGVLSDMGGVYTLGLSDGTTVNNNVIHDVYSYDLYGRGGWGLYNDEGTSRITMENNLVYNTKTGTYHQHYGEDNVIRNNIFAFSMDGQIQRSRIENHRSFFFTNNIVYWSAEQGALYTAGSFRDENVVSDHNLYWRTDGVVSFHDVSMEDWQTQGKEEGSIIADPGFKDPDNGDFTLPANSPALQVGFKPFDYSQAGLYGSEAWKAIVRGFTYPKVEFAPPPPPPPPAQFIDDFSQYAPGARPASADCNLENKGDNICVVEEVVGGNKCLMIEDAPGLQYEYNPHLVYKPNHKSGITTLSYDLKITAGVKLYNELRSWDVQPYRVGPSLTIDDGWLSVSGQDVMQLPENEWIHFEIQAAVGEDADGTWQFTVGIAGAEPMIYENLQNGNLDFASLSWVGWCSTATEKTHFYIDNLSITNSKYAEFD